VEDGEEGVADGVLAREGSMVSGGGGVTGDQGDTVRTSDQEGVALSRAGDHEPPLPSGEGETAGVAEGTVSPKQSSVLAAEEMTRKWSDSKDISTMPGYLPWEEDIEMVSAYLEKKVHNISISISSAAFGSIMPLQPH
jgi:hypothetical protein